MLGKTERARAAGRFQPCGGGGDGAMPRLSVLSEEHDETGRVLRVRGLPGAITRLRRSLAAH